VGMSGYTRGERRRQQQ